MEVKEVKRPKVSIWSITYNHAPFIKDCLEGILKQETNFDFELIIGDDASTDGTSDVLRDYAARYPEIIKPIIQEKNIGVYANSFENVYPELVGEYIAICEGDDYWEDSHKLQKQVDFLDQNKEFVASYHKCRLVDKEGRLIKENKFDRYDSFSKDDLLKGKGELITSSVMFRNVIRNTEDFKEISNFDTFLWHKLGGYGNAVFQDEIGSSVYRIHLGGVWSGASEFYKLQESIKTYFQIIKNLKIQGVDYEYPEKVVYDVINKFMIDSLKYHNVKEYLMMYLFVQKNEMLSFWKVLKIQFKYIIIRK
jgi:glycosyltransferase involved in cell wall biosynthesis